MPENKYNCLWGDCFVCTKERCEDKCSQYVDSMTEDGHFLYEQVQSRFETALEEVRKQIRHYDCNDEVS